VPHTGLFINNKAVCGTVWLGERSAAGAAHITET